MFRQCTRNMKQKKNSLSLYWKCQLIGWSLASLYWMLMGIIGTNFSLPLAILHFICDLIIYILPSHLFRTISLKNHWEKLAPKKLIVIVLPMVILLGLIFMLLTIGKNHLVSFYFYPGPQPTLNASFSASWLVTWVTGIRLMAIWILAYYLYHYAQAELKASKESARLSLVAKNAQLENLTAQLNPHFFFNSLNNIKALVTENPNLAKRAIDLLSELLRTSLYHRNTGLITLQDEIDLVKDYLELEKMRFEDRLQVNMEVDENALTVLILPLCIQTLVENAIKYGVAKYENGGKINVKIAYTKPFISILISNQGKLINNENRGLGLKNLIERLQLQYNGDAVFSITESENTVLAKLILPPT